MISYSLTVTMPGEDDKAVNRLGDGGAREEANGC